MEDHRNLADGGRWRASQVLLGHRTERRVLPHLHHVDAAAGALAAAPHPLAEAARTEVVHARHAEDWVVEHLGGRAGGRTRHTDAAGPCVKGCVPTQKSPSNPLLQQKRGVGRHDGGGGVNLGVWLEVKLKMSPRMNTPEEPRCNKREVPAIEGGTKMQSAPLKNLPPPKLTGDTSEVDAKVKNSAC